MQKTWSWSATGYSFVGKSHGEILETCKAAGIAGIEGAPPLFEGKSDAELEDIGKAFRKADIKIETFHLPFSAEDDIASFYETVRKPAVDKALLWMERAVLLGASIGIQHPTTTRYSVDVEGLDAYMRQIGRSLGGLLPAAEKLGFIIALENMLSVEGGRLGSRPEHFEQFIRDFDCASLGFCLDTGHALIASGPERASEFLDAMAPRMVAFHLADCEGYRDLHLPPGHGLVDWTAVFRKAAEIEFSRTMCIEARPFAPGPDYSPAMWKQMLADTDALVERALNA